MSEEDYAAPNGFTYPSLRSVFTHALSAETGYANRWRGVTDAPRITEADVPTIGALAARWREEEATLRDYLGGLTDEDLEREIVTQNRAGVEFRRSLAMD